jgi:hypothetical protein
MVASVLQLYPIGLVSISDLSAVEPYLPCFQLGVHSGTGLAQKYTDNYKVI